MEKTLQTEHPITAIILTKNEEKNIARCLDSLEFCQEILVIDDESTDQTLKIAKSKSAKVLKRTMKGNFAEQRNYGLSQAKNEWVLFVDSDETVGKELQISCLHTVREDKFDAYYIKRRDFWWGRELKFGETQKARNLGIIRLVKKNSGRWVGNVHEVFHTAKTVGTLEGFLDHHPHPSVKDFLQDINTYSTLRARELYGLGKSANVLSMIFYPAVKFILVYFVYLGFLDGPAGFGYAFLMSFHSFLVRAKLYQYRMEIKTDNEK